MSKSENRINGDELREMQAWPLDRKIQVTQTRIKEFYDYYDGNVYVSFSGGKDSTVLLDIARRVIPDMQGLFVDTGLEYPELRTFALNTPNIIVKKPDMNFKQVLKKYGYPLISKEVANKVAGAKPGNTRWQQLNGEYINPRTGELSMYNIEKWKFLLDADFKISDMCCKIMKKNPSIKYMKETGSHPILGLMACESRKRRIDYMRTGCNAFDNAHPQSQPMAFWTEQDVLKYLYDYEIPYAPVYGDIVVDAGGRTILQAVIEQAVFFVDSVAT